MRLLLDECAGGRYLRDSLIAAGHDVLRTVDVLGGGADDPAVFAFACHNDRTVMTFNGADFVRLGAGAITHPGVLLIYQDNRPSDMTAVEIVKALSNVIAVRPNGISGELIVLNQYRW
jgi:predicted nuclease of predicted toxin-antitoxin system